MIDSDGVGSLSVIVPVPEPAAIVERTGFERPTVNVSSASSSRSSTVFTVTVFVVWPGVKVSVPLLDV